jgi:hypothetical protein
MEVQRRFVTCLTIRQPGELFGVTEQELNLETGLVKPIDVPGGEVNSGRKQQGGVHFIPIRFEQVNHPASPFEVNAIDHRRIQADTLFRFPHELKAV